VTRPAPRPFGTRVLVVDDDPTVSDVVRRYLERAGHRVDLAVDGPGALVAVERWVPDLVVLDRMLPGLDGIEVCRRLRRAGHPVPVIMLTALGEETDRVLGLEVGADDYLAKPFSPRELVLRVQSVLRRTGRAPAPTAGLPVLVTDGDLTLDTRRRLALRESRELPLTGREFDLLLHLVRNPGRALRREDLLTEVWGWSFGNQSTVTVHVRRLREKIEPDPARPCRIVTVWGVGYRYEPAGSGA
jgi:DNA-binding response OmpR family regulator